MRAGRKPTAAVSIGLLRASVIDAAYNPEHYVLLSSAAARRDDGGGRR